MKGRRNYSSEYKVKLVLEVLEGKLTLNEVAAGYGLNPNQLATWKREFMERVPSLFDEKKQAREQRKSEKDAEAEKEQMLKTIGQLTLERDYLKAANGKLFDRGLL